MQKCPYIKPYETNQLREVSIRKAPCLLFRLFLPYLFMLLVLKRSDTTYALPYGKPFYILSSVDEDDGYNLCRRQIKERFQVLLINMSGKTSILFADATLGFTNN